VYMTSTVGSMRRGNMSGTRWRKGIQYISPTTFIAKQPLKITKNVLCTPLSNNIYCQAYNLILIL
jgi:hypothetical protein